MTPFPKQSKYIAKIFLRKYFLSNQVERLTARLQCESASASASEQLEAENADLRARVQQLSTQLTQLSSEYTLLTEQLEEQRQRHSEQLRGFDTSKQTTFHLCMPP